MKRVIFLFLDGVGLGSDDPTVNPLAAARLPVLLDLLGGRRPTASSGRHATSHAHLIPTDAHLGVEGCPQSATGQATILTGINAAKRLGQHYGPRPDDRVRAVIDEGSIFARLKERGRNTWFGNAYPQGYFDAIERGKRRLGAVPYAARAAGQALLTADDLYAGRAMSANFTGEGWRDKLGYPDAPVYSAEEAGVQLWKISEGYDFLFFEHWLTDYLGHYRNLDGAIENFECIDSVIGGLLDAADLAETLIIVGSDHGNVEDCTDRRHTDNPALTLLLGADRDRYAERIHDLADYVPVIMDFLCR